MSGSVWRFAGFEYSPQSGLWRDGAQLHLGPQARQLLELLLESRGGVVSKAEIAARLWPDRPPSDDSIDRCAYLLRKPLREAGYGDLIATAYGRGLSLRATIDFLDPDGVGAPATDRRVDGRTLDLWQTAYELAGKRTRDGYERAHSAIAAAGELDPSSPAVWSLSADIAAGRAIRGHLCPAEAAAMIERDAGRALALAPGFTAALAVLGWAQAALMGRTEDGLALMDRAVGEDPTYSKVRAYRGWVLARLDRLQEAIDDTEAGLRLSPHDQGLLIQRAWLELCMGNIAESVELAHKGLFLRPDGGWLRGVAAIAASLSGDHAAAEEAARQGLELVPEDPALFAVLAAVLARAGRNGEAADMLSAARGDGGGCAAPSLFTAAALLAMDQPEAALGEISRGRDAGCPWFAFAPHDPRLAPLRDEIRRLAATEASSPLGG
ncbi:winged helix-turn-helix domain-containing protein [Methylocystis parvus]|uniref:winged helix-turn-helix domain-containing protein n=1 Tax=Methylocystis parvus TaxID=134 RepID=UPI003C70E0C6